MCDDFDCGWGCVFMNNGHSGTILFVSVVSRAPYECIA